jgi:hypothetical protein
LAISTACSSLSNGITARTGPNASSWAANEPGSTSAMTVGATK